MKVLGSFNFFRMRWTMCCIEICISSCAADAPQRHGPVNIDGSLLAGSTADQSQAAPDPSRSFDTLSPQATRINCQVVVERYGIEIAVDRADVSKVRAATRDWVQPRARKNFRECSSQQDHSKNCGKPNSKNLRHVGNPVT